MLVSQKVHRRSSAFTLLELLVVMAIIIIILAITFPAYRTLTSGNNKREAVNAISAQVAAARSLALSSQRQVGLLFYEDPQTNSQSFMVLVQAVQNVNNGTEFGAIPERSPIALPRYIKIANLSATSASVNYLNESSAAAQRLRILVFNEKGQPIIRSGFLAYDADNNSNSRSARSVWGLGNGGASSMSLAVYDVNEFNEATAGLDDAGRANWLLNYTDLITLHPYTGTVIR